MIKDGFGFLAAGILKILRLLINPSGHLFF